MWTKWVAMGNEEGMKSTGGDEAGKETGLATLVESQERDGGKDDWSAPGPSDVDRLLRTVQDKCLSDETKASVGDFVRLLQLRKEMVEESPKEIEIRWVEPSETENAPA